MKIPFIQDRSELLRWALSGAAVVFLHGAVAGAMINWSDDSATEPPAALVVDLAPFPTAPKETIENAPPGPLRPDSVAAQQIVVKEVKEEIEERLETEPSHEEVQPDLPRAVNPEVALDTTPPRPDQKAEIPQEARPQSEESAPPPIPEAAPAEVAAAPIQGRPIVDRSNEIPKWRNLVLALLERNKRIPADATNNRGIAEIAFSIDRKGRVMSSRVVKSSGSAVLDREAIEMVQRSQPFPPPPAALPGAEVRLGLPVRFNMPGSGRE
jgi:protein TonB